MTQLSEPNRTRILPPSPVDPEEVRREREVQQALEERCRPLFERLRSTLRETHPNWFIAIDPDTEDYLLDPTLRGLTQKISQVHTGNSIRMIFRINDTGTCGRLWV
ncbi:MULTISPECIES: hypothetical protein [Nostocales]|uniref:Uncharacterized protein n=3 Tax=Nostocales TaxID=1161 RepID=A0A0C1R5B8_9CYAN|nr:hypothetical protein [Tolypothrix bouteillei]KAF3888331.1 hypothetical protein DA73_0400024700 [Tolypothrix bouteillei VB521301]